MPTATSTRVLPSGARYDGAVIDGMIFQNWPSTAALSPYFEPGWRETVMRPGDLGGPLSLRARWLHQHPFGEFRPDSYPPEGVPGSDLGVIGEQVLDVADTRAAVLGYSDGMLATALNNYWLARETTRAVNRWTLTERLADPRLRGVVLACTAVPETAADDIAEFGRDDRMAAVALGGNCLGRAFGHTVYHPIYQAAAELDLPIIIQAGSDSMSSLDSSPTAGGLVSTYAQYATQSSHTLMAHMASMIMSGVFEKYPNLRVLLVGGGVTWLPAYAWRMDFWFKTTDHETPWVKRLPSEYLADHVRVGTHSLEAPRNPAELQAAFGSWRKFEKLMVYTSGYPRRECELSADVSVRIPTPWHESVFHDNAERFFRLSGPSAAAAATESLQKGRR
ncbi:amidohydrolase family protein [Rhodococcus sp. T2V]|uniref:amidohydrolase family protein n=1 Tax=Rhodococcus sp. T2V TaxID=3034164 RepID=UPI0023E21753|nr:amidohydrolase family protein [Rhodococcus sp. T2V]MDF3311468.1 amidohydrolase family protein [Rhodococcus sp. T2V]